MLNQILKFHRNVLDLLFDDRGLLGHFDLRNLNFNSWDLKDGLYFNYFRFSNDNWLNLAFFLLQKLYLRLSFLIIKFQAKFKAISDWQIPLVLWN